MIPAERAQFRVYKARLMKQLEINYMKIRIMKTNLPREEKGTNERNYFLIQNIFIIKIKSMLDTPRRINNIDTIDF